MGVDLLDLIFRIEREFDIKISKEALQQLFFEHAESLPKQKKFKQDVQVADFVTFIEKSVLDQHSVHATHTASRLKRLIVECLYVDESEVTLDAWMIRELGME